MRWGLIARAETGRGLGVQSYEIFRHLHPDKTLIVNTPDTYVVDEERYGDATVVDLDDGLPEEQVRDWMSGLDVVLSVETLYDWRLADWARADGVKTIVQGNPEFYVHGMQTELPQPDQWWWPTSWRPFGYLPQGVHVPVPVPDDIPLRAADPNDPTLRFLFVGGKAALGDRNGSQTIIDMIPRARQRYELSMRSQGTPATRLRFNSNLVVKTYSDAQDRWSMYAGHHALVLPRRYGGLCLPALEAMASGLALVMPDISPNLDDWPILSVSANLSRRLHTQAGTIRTYDTSAQSLANRLDGLVVNRMMLADAQAASRAWADKNRWSQLADRYHAEIEAVL